MAGRGRKKAAEASVASEDVVAENLDEAAIVATGADALDAVLALMRAKNKGSNLGTLSGDRATEDLAVTWASSGVRGVDSIIGKGLPRGRIIEIYGQEGSGKSTLALQIVAAAQSRGEICGYIDAEHAVDLAYARNLGVNTDHLIFDQPMSGEDGLNLALDLVKTRKVSVIIVDSVAALTPQKELDGEVGDQAMGAQARMMSQSMRMMNGHAAVTDTLVIFINQIRQKVGVVFGSPNTTPGGNALKFYASVRLEVVRIGSISEADIKTANKTKIKCVKNRVGAPYREVEVEIRYGKGIYRFSEVFDIAEAMGIIKKSGSWCTYKEVRLQGRGAFIDHLEAHPVLCAEIEAEIDSRGSP